MPIPTNVEMQPVESSNIGAIGFDAEEKVLYVRFKNGGEYSYNGVPDRIWEGLRTAASHGGYLASMIKGKYAYDKL